MVTKTKKYIFIILVYFQIAGVVSAQNKHKIDSLQALISKTPEDTNLVNLYYKLGNQYEAYKSKERIEYYITALELAKKIQFNRGINRISLALITVLYHRNMNDISMEYCIQYKTYLENNGFKKELLELCNTLGNLYSKQGNYILAMKYYNRALNYHDSLNNQIKYAKVLNNISILMGERGLSDSCLFYSLKASEIFRKEHDADNLANCLVGIASLKAKKKDIAQAKTIAKEAIALYDSINSNHGLCNANIALSDVYYSEHNNDSALVYLKNAERYLNLLNFILRRSEVFQRFSILYAAVRNYSEAYRYQLLYKQNEDTISSGSLKEKMMELEAKYDISKKESLLKQNKLELEINKKQKSFLLLGIGLVFVLLLGAFYAYFQKNKSNKIIAEQKKTVEEKQKEILDSIRYAKRIQSSLLPTEKYIQKKLNELRK